MRNLTQIGNELRELLAQRILIKREHFVIGEHAQREIIDLSQIATDQQRRGQQTPKADVGVLLVGRQAGGMKMAPAHFPQDQHVGIVPMARPGKLLVPVLVKPDTGHAAPRIADVAGGAPAIAADLRAPFPHVAHAVLTEAENDVAILFAQGGVHDLVRLHQALALGQRFVLHAVVGAPVVFEIVESPGGILLGVFLFVLPTGLEAGAGLGSGRGINPNFKAFGMDVIGQRFHVRELGVRMDHALRVALTFPGVVDIHINIAGVPHSACHDLIGRVTNILVGDLIGEIVPAIPAHWRRFCDCWRLTAGGDGKTQNGQRKCSIKGKGILLHIPRTLYGRSMCGQI